jgi:hypothetical protein
MKFWQFIMLAVLVLGATALNCWLLTSIREPEEPQVVAVENAMKLPSLDQLLLPPRGSKRMLYDEADFNKALVEAQKGDMEYMFGLIEWYSRHGQAELADQWMIRLDEERKARGLPSWIDSLPPVMRGDTPVPKLTKPVGVQ